MADAVNSTVANGSEDGATLRRGRLPRWTRREVLVLIEGKRLVESQGRRRAAERCSPASLTGPVEPKWAAVAAYCRRHGVERGALQCQKRWSNLLCDFKKVREWERVRAAKRESFWVMRSDRRRERRLPGSFDREIYQILGGATEDEEEDVKVAAPVMEEEEEAVFDSGRTAAEDGLFSDSEQEIGEDLEEERPAVAVMPISERKYEPFHEECSDPGMVNDKHCTENLEKGSTSQGQKRRRTSQGGAGDTTMQNQLIDVLERNSRMLAAQLEAQNMNCQLDRDQRKDHAGSLLNVLNKFANILERIADKL